MRNLIIFALLAGLAAPAIADDAAPVTAAAPEPLNLTCGGGGSKKELNSSHTSIYGTGGYASAQTMTTDNVGYDAQVDVRLYSGDDRIRLPRTILPPVHGGEDGWFKLKDLETTASEITGRAAINAVNKPHVHIDRITGVIEIAGMNGNFTGQCKKVDTAVDKPLF